MRIDVDLLPGHRSDESRSVCVVVDVLRASSSIVTLIDRGAACVVAAADIEQARHLHERLPGYLLCGEKNGLPPPGFDYGNSPAEFSRLDLSGRPVLLATSNGTCLLAALADMPAVFVGALLNRTAAARAAVEMAREERLNITIACSAAYGGSTFVLEDALGAGAIVDAALGFPDAPQPLDAARFTRDAFTVAARDLPAAVASSYHARELIEGGLGEDVEYSAQLDVSQVVPVLERAEDRLLVLRAWKGRRRE